MSPRLPKKVDPAVSFTCANCKRVLPLTDKDKERLRCADRKACGEALAAWLSKETFAYGGVGDMR